MLIRFRPARQAMPDSIAVALSESFPRPSGNLAPFFRHL